MKRKYVWLDIHTSDDEEYFSNIVIELQLDQDGVRTINFDEESMLVTGITKYGSYEYKLEGELEDYIVIGELM